MPTGSTTKFPAPPESAAGVRGWVRELYAHAGAQYGADAAPAWVSGVLESRLEHTMTEAAQLRARLRAVLLTPPARVALLERAARYDGAELSASRDGLHALELERAGYADRVGAFVVATTFGRLELGAWLLERASAGAPVPDVAPPCEPCAYARELAESCSVENAVLAHEHERSGCAECEAAE